MKSKLYIVVPAYNEEELIEDSVLKINDKIRKLIKLKKVSNDSKIIVIDDGSKDNTYKILKGLELDNLIVIKLSRNYGHQNAMYAGLMFSKDEADFTITMDSDLQDDINAIDKMIDEYYKGNEIVYGIRNNRDTDNFFKKKSAIIFYRLMKFLGVEIIINHADFRLMSKKSLESLSLFEESNLFLRGIIPQLGYKTSNVYYKRLKRQAGISKYNLKKMLGLALDGITSFSIKPIRFISIFGLLLSVISCIYLIYVVISYFSNSNLVSGWTTIISLISFFGSFQILCIGIIGEYLSKIYVETKKRPKYIIEDIIR